MWKMLNTLAICVMMVSVGIGAAWYMFQIENTLREPSETEDTVLFLFYGIGFNEIGRVNNTIIMMARTIFSEVLRVSDFRLPGFMVKMEGQKNWTFMPLNHTLVDMNSDGYVNTGDLLLVEVPSNATGIWMEEPPILGGGIFLPLYDENGKYICNVAIYGKGGSGIGVVEIAGHSDKSLTLRVNAVNNNLPQSGMEIIGVLIFNWSTYEIIGIANNSSYRIHIKGRAHYAILDPNIEMVWNDVNNNSIIEVGEKIYVNLTENYTFPDDFSEITVFIWCRLYYDPWEVGDEVIYKGYVDTYLVGGYMDVEYPHGGCGCNETSDTGGSI